MPIPLLVPGALAAVASGTTAGAGVATGAGVAAAVGTGVAAGTTTVGTGTAIAAGGGGLASVWMFIKHLFHIGSVAGTGTAAAVGTGVAVKAVAAKVVTAKVIAAKAAVGKVAAGKVVAGKVAAGKVAAGKTVAGKTAAGKVAAGKTAAVPQQGMSNMIYTEDPFPLPIPLPNPVPPPLPPLDPVNKAFLDGALTGATIAGITGVTVALFKGSNENNDTPNTAIPDTEPPNTVNNNSSPVTENDRRRRRQNQRSEPFSESTCAICLEEMSDVNNIVVNCGHRFHADCFLNYSRSQNTSVVCPVCRESDIM